MKDGGAAFPILEQVRGVLDCTDPGMSLRDYFAGQALAALAHDYTEQKLKFNRADVIIAEYAYKLADAMLAEREKRNG